MNREDIDPRAEVLRRLETLHARVLARGAGHYIAANRVGRLNYWIGVPSIVASTSVATAIFSTLTSNPAVGWQVATGLVSIAAAALAALQTFFRFAERSGEHHAAGGAYADLRAKIEMAQLRVNAGLVGDPEKLIAQLEAHLLTAASLASQSPMLPRRAFDEGHTETDDRS
jgi:hypothetical protein